MRSVFSTRILFILTGALGLIWGALVSAPCLAQTLPLPPRSSAAPTGSQLKDSLAPLALQDRENTIFNEVMAGNVPTFLRTLVPVEVTASLGGSDRTARYFVTPEYVALGSNEDYFLMPMTPLLAQRIADRLQCNLPTRKMVNDIWAAAAVKLTPSPIPPSAAMTTVPVFWDHNVTVWGQRQPTLADHPLGALVGGHKKDVVVTARLATTAGKVAIYGWHYPDGSNIQPLYLGHGDTYADYSHGIRLIQLAMTVNGAATTVPEVLADPVLNPLLSDEGAFTSYRYPVTLPQPPTGNLVKNGSFEDGFTNGVGDSWISWLATGSDPITYGRASVNKHDGSYSQYWSRSDTLPFDGGVYQQIEVQAGRRYRISAWIKRQSTLDGTLLRIGYDPDGGTEGTAPSVVYTDLVTAGPNDSWVSYDVKAVATGPTLTVFARAGHTGTSGGTNAYFYFDEVSVVADDAGTTWSLH